MKTFFRKNLLHWHATENNREMPWKGIKNPYHIWLSEIILQQTRVEQGLPYFKKFIQHYPNIMDLANATEDEVMKDWEGLGYYSRARNLHAAAKYVAFELNGDFPTTYETLLALKGVGPYTAAAIASFAYDLPFAVVDGNVTRILSRFFNIDLAIDSSQGKKHFQQLAQELLSTENPASYNQAIMDFGATVCTPKKPLCSCCPFENECLGNKNDRLDYLPFKEKKISKKERYFYFILISDGNEVLINKRTENGIWKNLYQFPLFESLKLVKEKQIKKWLSNTMQTNITIEFCSEEVVHILTHRKIKARFIKILNSSELWANKNLGQKFPIDKLDTLAFPRLIDRFLENNKYILKNKI